MAKELGEAKKLGFGLMRLPLTDKNDDRSIDPEQLNRMVDRFLERGFTYFDTAWMYHGGKSEEAVKTALVERHPRDSFTLTTKLHLMMLENGKTAEDGFNEQLRRTGAGFFDYYWIHDVNSHSIGVYEEKKCFDFILEKKHLGLVKHIGISFHDGPELLEKVLTDHPELEYVQLQLNYLDWDNAAVQSRRCLETAVRHGKGVVVMEPVKGGTLSKLPPEAEALLRKAAPDMSVSSWAIRFAASRPGVVMVLSGMSNPAQVEDNTSYMSDLVPLTREEDALLARCAEMIERSITVPCTGCSYCTSACPKGIPIPRYFSLYNQSVRELETKAWTPMDTYYENLTAKYSKASDCLRCGRCEIICPQHLKIRKYLQDVAKHFES